MKQYTDKDFEEMKQLKKGLKKLVKVKYLRLELFNGDYVLERNELLLFTMI
ncbi:hypothetical protein [Enterococcus mundtii]|uniref:hypothetical protein n=1 Tax=Enterococcus mundtii TaxID=53346 RepID=UPI001891FDE7|nr:hypothetical protein [Enterococcus mundtii]